MWMVGMLLPWMVCGSQPPAPADGAIRFATFNIKELTRPKIDELDADGSGTNPQLRSAAQIIQSVQADVLLINEIDYDAETQRCAKDFLERYLKVSQSGGKPCDYPHVYIAAVNTGVEMGMDLDRDGKSDGPADRFGYGRYPGQYGMALFSRHPFDTKQVRTFQRLLWREMPDNLLPDGTSGKPDWYAPEAAAILRLSSKSHWDVPVRIGSTTVHVLASHPTPPVFDGDEDRNGRRNYDEIRLWADYLTAGKAAAYVVDDQGRRGGLPITDLFVIMGDLNADPTRDEGPYGQPAIQQLLQHPRVQDAVPTGPAESAGTKRIERTSEFGRVDYVLPAKGLRVVNAGVFRPIPGDPLHRLVETSESSSDHYLVWVDVIVPK